MNTLTKLYLLLLVVFISVQACCKKSFDDLYLNANAIEVNNTYNFRDISDGVTINQEGYHIKFIFSDAIKEAIEEINAGRKSLDYCEDNEVALKKDITHLVISCDKAIWNTSAGTSLDQNFIRFFEHTSSNDSENLRLTVADWLQLINNENQFLDFEWYLEFNQLIDSNEFLKFQFLFELADGSEYIKETESVKFE